MHLLKGAYISHVDMFINTEITLHGYSFMFFLHFYKEKYVITLLLQLFCCASTPGNDPQDLMSFRPLFYKTVFYRLHSIKHNVTFKDPNSIKISGSISRVRITSSCQIL